MRFSWTNLTLATLLAAVSVSFAVRDWQYRKTTRTLDFIWHEYLETSRCMLGIRQDVIEENDAMQCDGVLTPTQSRTMQWSFGIDPDTGDPPTEESIYGH